MRKIIIDCDPGHDDIVAIITALAHKDELEILGITTVAGNQTLDKVTNNILKVEEYLNINIPVYKGYDKPILKKPMPQAIAHGDSGMDGPILPEPILKAQDKSAIEFYKEVLERNDKITIVGLAPLTNIAYLIKEYPDLIKSIEEIIIMGGALNGGNINKYAEFNIWHDPEAAKIVFDSNIKVIMAPLEVCYAGGILIKEFERFHNNKKVSKLIFDLLEFYGKYAIDRNWDKTAIFDLVPIVYLLKPELFKSKEGKIDIILDGIDNQGQTIFNEIEANHIVLLDTDREEFMQVFFDAVDYLDKYYQEV